MPDEAVLITESNGPYRARFRKGTAADRTTLVEAWVPVLERGPDGWLDREWSWETFGADELHLDVNPEWIVLADELEPGASGEIFGVLVTTGPMTAQQAGVHHLLKTGGGFIWVEYIAISPTLRKDCPERLRRRPLVKAVGSWLIRRAIARSLALGLDGRLGLHAEGETARWTYAESWDMPCIGDAVHTAGGLYPVYFGDAAWAVRRLSAGPPAGGRR